MPDTHADDDKEDPVVEPITKRPRACHDAESEKPTAAEVAMDDDDASSAAAAVAADRYEDNNQRPFKMLPFYGEHKRAVSSLAFAPTSLSSSSHGAGTMSCNSNAGLVPILCASASADGCAKVWDLTSSSSEIISGTISNIESTKLDPKFSLIGHGRGINGKFYNEVHGRLYHNYIYPEFHTWYIPHSTTQPIESLDVTWSPTASYIVTASDDKTLRLWCAETGDAFVEFRGHASFVFSCKFNPQSNLLVSGSYDETVKLWDIRCGECVATLRAHSNPVTGVDFNRDGTCIVSGSYDGLVRIWDTATGECLKTVYSEGNLPVGSVRFSPNGRFVLTGTLDSKLRLYDVLGGYGRGSMFGTESHSNGRPQPRGGKCAKTYTGHKNSKYCVFAAFLSANPKRQCVVSGSEDGMIYLYDLQSRLIRQTLKGHEDAVLAVDAHNSVELIGSGGMTKDKCVRFWSTVGI